MKKYQVTWGWQPPQYDRPKGNFRLFFYTEEVEREVTHKDFETGEETTEIIHEWLCDVVEYEGSEAAEILRLIKEDKNSVECKRWLLKAKIEAYDKSRHVNDFTISGIHLWLDSTMRGKVKENLETCQQLGEEYTTLRFEGMAFPVTVQMGWQMYYAVLAYARDSWNVTEAHLASADKLETAEEFDSYDYTAGYPAKLGF
jgi:hypothetical protein